MAGSYVAQRCPDARRTLRGTSEVESIHNHAAHKPDLSPPSFCRPHPPTHHRPGGPPGRRVRVPLGPPYRRYPSEVRADLCGGDGHEFGVGRGAADLGNVTEEGGGGDGEGGRT